MDAMTIESPSPRRQRLVRAQHVREAIRDAAGGFAPDHVGRFLRNSFMEPDNDEAPEVASLLKGLIELANERMSEAGIEPGQNRKGPPPKLSRRERENAANLSMLYAGLSIALVVANNDTDAVGAGRRALTWAETVGDHAQQSIAWCMLASAHHRAGRYDEWEYAVMRELETARVSESPTLIAEALGHRVGLYIELRRHDEALQANTEAFAYMETGMSEQERHPFYASALMHEARVLFLRNRFAEAVQTLRQALQWADPTEFPLTRSTALTRLGEIYRELAQYHLCIDCQREVVGLAEVLGSSMVRAWGYYYLAVTHTLLKEHDRALELLSNAELYAPASLLSLRLNIISRKARLLLETGNPDAAIDISLQLIETIGDAPMGMQLATTLLTLGEAEAQNGRLEVAEEYHRRAVETAESRLPGRTWRPKVLHAEVLVQLGRFDEALALLAHSEFTATPDVQTEHHVKAFRLRAAIAEHRGDMRAVVAHEREAFALERQLLERKADESLRNTRVMAQIELLEREADLERERRRRAERELADAVVALGDRKRAVATAEERLRTVLAHSTNATERVVTNTLRDALATLKAGTEAQGTPLQYLAGVEDEFYTRLRARFPNLTRKQERLCGLIRAGLASKEIATLMELEPEGLKALRKRLRRTLGIDEKERLEKLIAEI